MKTLSIQNPWAPLIVAGIKNVENRTFSTKYRGPLLIHCSGRSHSWINLGDMPMKFQKKHDDLLRVPLDEYPTEHLQYERLLEEINEKHYHLSNDISDDADPRELEREMRSAIEKYGPAFKSGCIIGQVDLVGIYRGDDNDAGKSEWAEPYQFHWVFENPVKFEKPIPAKGKLNLWDFEMPM